MGNAGPPPADEPATPHAATPRAGLGEAAGSGAFPPQHAQPQSTVFIREPGGTASRVAIAALGQHGEAPRARVQVRATTEVSLTAAGPFEPLGSALVRDSALRVAFAGALDLPSVRAYARLRPLFFVGLVPLLMLAELDREMLGGFHGARVRLALGLAFAAAMAVDFVRKVPRYPGTSAAVLFWVAARYLHILAVTCGRAENAAVGAFAPVLAAGVALTLLARAPRGNRLTEEMLDRLGIEPSDALRVRLGAIPPPRVVAAAVGAALGLPVLLGILRHGEASIWTTGAVLVCYGAVVPELVERLVERDRAPRQPMRLGRLAFAAAVGFALTTGLVSGAHRTFDAGIYLQRCTHPEAFEREGRRLLEAETREVDRGIARAKGARSPEGALPILLMTVLAVPLAEERLYRGLLQRVLTRRYGERLGLFYSALVFGAAHLAVYRVASYQAALLGFGFGVAWLEGGLAASFLAHAVWNAHLLL